MIGANKHMAEKERNKEETRMKDCADEQVTVTQGLRRSVQMEGSKLFGYGMLDTRQSASPVPAMARYVSAK